MKKQTECPVKQIIIETWEGWGLLMLEEGIQKFSFSSLTLFLIKGIVF